MSAALDILEGGGFRENAIAARLAQGKDNMASDPIKSREADATADGKVCCGCYVLLLWSAPSSH